MNVGCGWPWRAGGSRCWSPWHGCLRRRRARRRRARPGCAGPAGGSCGPRTGGALAVLAVLDRGVVAVVRGGGAGVGLAGLVGGPAQHRRSLPGQPPGRALAVGGVDGDVQPGEPDRLAGGGEPVFPGQPAGQRQRGAGPPRTAVRARTLAPVRCRAASVSWCRSSCCRVSRASSISSAVATCSCPRPGTAIRR